MREDHRRSGLRGPHESGFERRLRVSIEYDAHRWYPGAYGATRSQLGIVRAHGAESDGDGVYIRAQPLNFISGLFVADPAAFPRGIIHLCVAGKRELERD